MDAYVLAWLIVSVVLGIIEGFTVSLVSIWVAVGAIAASITAALGGDVIPQFVVFILISTILLIITRPLAKKFISSKSVPTNADRLIGQTAMVILKIDPIENKGQIKAMGQIWSAKGLNYETIDEGEKVHIEKIEGVYAIVSPIK